MEIELFANLLAAGTGAEYLHLDAGRGKLRSHWMDSGHYYFGLIELLTRVKPFHLTLDRKQVETALKSLGVKQFDTVMLKKENHSVILQTDSMHVSMPEVNPGGHNLKSLLKAMKKARLPRIAAVLDLQELKKGLKVVRMIDGGHYFRVLLSHKGEWLTIKGDRAEVQIASGTERRNRAEVKVDGEFLLDTVEWLGRVGASKEVSLLFKKDTPCKVSAYQGSPEALAYLAPVIEGE